MDKETKQEFDFLTQAVAKGFNEVNEKIDSIEDRMATKEDTRGIMEILEGIATIAKKIQEDHTFAIEWPKRLQTQVERQEEEIRQIKLQLKLT